MLYNNKDWDYVIEKAFGKKDLTKLHKEVVTDKNGHRTTVWKKNDDVDSKGSKGESEQTESNSKGVTVAQGDVVSFFNINANGKKDNLQGEVKSKGSDGAIVEVAGKQYKVHYADLINVDIPVNANDSIRFLMSRNSIKTGWRGTDGLQPKSCDTIEGLMKSIEQVRQEFSNLSEYVKNEFKDLNPILLKRPKLKSIDRIKEKLREDAQNSLKDALKVGVTDFKPYEYDKDTDTYHCRTIRDCDGHTFCMRSVEDVSKILNYYNKKGYTARIKNNFAKPTDVGYSDININIKLSNGSIVELQLNTTANMVAKERYGHALYEVYRSIKSNPKYSELAEFMENAQKELYKQSNEYSKKGNYPDDIPNENIYDSNYKHKPYADTIKPFCDKAKSLYEKAKADGVLNKTTCEHFEHLLDYIK